MARNGIVALIFWLLMLIWFIDLWIAGPTLRQFVPWLAVLLLGFAALGSPVPTRAGAPIRDDLPRP